MKFAFLFGCFHDCKIVVLYMKFVNTKTWNDLKPSKPIKNHLQKSKIVFYHFLRHFNVNVCASVVDFNQPACSPKMLCSVSLRN